MHRKPIIILIVLTVLIFGNSLLNGFVGDDHFLITNNKFYTSWSNLKDLFTSKYLANSVDVLNVQDQGRYSSGSIAYRPALSLTYFLDYFIWQLKPFGYHLTNLLWHLANVVGVYGLIFLLTRTAGLSFLTALLFAVHPYKSEAVCGIGYRADLVSTYFLLMTFILYIAYASQTKKMHLLILSWLSFGLALFSKESVIIFPGLLLMYDCWINPDGKRLKFSEYLRRYSGYIVVILSFLYVYVYVFPNKTVETLNWFGGNVLNHAAVCIHIFGEYLTGFFMPGLVKVLPPAYKPPVEQPWGIETQIVVLIIILCLFLFYRMSVQQKLSKFFVGWFLIALIPVSNLIPLANPMAHRFMYLPSVGICFILARLIFDIGGSLNIKTKSQRFIYILALAYVGSSLIMTVKINAMWRHNYIMAFRLYENHPNDPFSSMLMGITYQKIGETEKAKDILVKALSLGLEDPRAYYVLGQCMLNDLDAAQRYLEEGVHFYPDYGMLRLGLGRIYLLKGQTDKALFQIKKSIELTPSYRGYCYLTQIYLMKGDEQAVRQTLEDIKRDMPDPKYYDFIQTFISRKDKMVLPKDIGL
ncbi:MAG: hypothetical protein KBD53_00605 [Candidatus Omnitrophica bacterium]|nr:hypothetical protein [Candidatus Omnitrophota bacterium]